ncbi:subtilisin-like protease [Oryza brachyantha]|uniref:subtilisin-like protease n=1 Tax=Oryza brachyantha TaxID=4533 RepID=UPI0007765E6C|nr:subtilisin-like protease [Oryza brachyantha]
MELAHVVPPRRHDNLRKKRRLMHSHQHVLDGFASWLTEAELEAVSIKLGFSKSTLDGPMYLDTTHSPSFLGLSPDNFWGYTEYGSGVIIGVIDFGINSSHPSQTGGKDPVDYIGHNKHVALITAGNFVNDASFHGQAVGTASGIAPNAHLASYKVCYTLTDDSDDYHCPMTSIVAGMESVVVDGVDIISISLSSGEMRFDRDPVAMGTFRAVAKGIPVVASASNSGPDRFSVTNDVSWIITVGRVGTGRIYHRG